jgi:hypothetical protein
MKAEIGELGEICWRKVIFGKGGERWDYDISPEFVFHRGMPL